MRWLVMGIFSNFWIFR